MAQTKATLLRPILKHKLNTKTRLKLKNRKRKYSFGSSQGISEWFGVGVLGVMACVWLGYTSDGERAQTTILSPLSDNKPT